MNAWRPKKWGNKYEKLVVIKIDEFEYRLSPSTIYDAGANAMLTYLFSQEHQDWLATPGGKTAIGKWVFIPDKEV